jgi:hypothetical protein
MAMGKWAFIAHTSFFERKCDIFRLESDTKDSKKVIFSSVG